jgi:hypothetical protein
MDEKEKEIEIEEFKKIREQQDKESLKINITQNIMYKCVKNGFTIKIDDYTIQFDDKETITINDLTLKFKKFKKNEKIEKHNSYLLNNNVDINTLNSEIKNLNHVLGNESKYTKFEYMGLYFRGAYTYDKFKNDNPNLEEFIDDNFEYLKQFGYHGENAFNEQNEQNENFENILTNFTATLTPPEPLIKINGFINNTNPFDLSFIFKNKSNGFINNTNPFDLSLKIKDFIEIFVKPPTTKPKKTFMPNFFNKKTTTGGKRRSQKIKRKRRRTIKKHKKTKSKK